MVWGVFVLGAGWDAVWLGGSLAGDGLGGDTPGTMEDPSRRDERGAGVVRPGSAGVVAALILVAVLGSAGVAGGDGRGGSDRGAEARVGSVSDGGSVAGVVRSMLVAGRVGEDVSRGVALPALEALGGGLRDGSGVIDGWAGGFVVGGVLGGRVGLVSTPPPVCA